MRRDELIDALWAHEGAPPWDTALAPVLSRLRRAIEPATLEGRDTLRLVSAAGVGRRRGDRRLRPRRRRQAARGRRAHRGRAAAPVRRALAAGAARDLEELRLQALETLARGGDERAGRAAVAVAPFRESARAALIEALTPRERRRGAALLRRAARLCARNSGRCLVRSSSPCTSGCSRPPPTPAHAPPGWSNATTEVAAIAAAIARLHLREGGVLAFEGPAGIGKTRLLAVLREHAVDAGATVLDARAGLLEREFGFGVVRQLFEAVAAGEPPPAAARAVFGGDAPSSDGLFSVLAALFQYTAGLATRGPLVLCIDDLQWSDTASLRFVAYLARRVAGLPVLVGASIRTGEPDSDELLLGEISQDPATVAVEPRPLSADGTADLVADLLGDAGDAFAAACLQVTGGNPLLLRQLLTAFREREGPRDAASVHAIGPRAVSKTVLLRLNRLPAPAADVARAVAILGEQPGLEALAALAGTPEPVVADTIEALVRAEILRADDPAVAADPGPARLRPPARPRRRLPRAARRPPRPRARPRGSPARESRRRAGADRGAADARAAAG